MEGAVSCSPSDLYMKPSGKWSSAQGKVNVIEPQVYVHVGKGGEVVMDRMPEEPEGIVESA